MDIHFRSIGVIHSPFHEKETTPIQPSRSKAAGQVEVCPEYAEGLVDLEGFSHIYLLYEFHYSEGYQLKVTPYLDHVERGLFSTRYPCRPNQIGLSLVELVERSDNVLLIQGVDVLDGTPLLDIKPYVIEFDVRTNTRNGWFTPGE
jgi:tRNA-Thr(GGU) m(6)t(6)A37 methyltransferase TsaA